VAGHICGSFDSSERGVWELFLSTQQSPDGSLAPGVHFASRDHRWESLGPWAYPEGRASGCTPSDCSVVDTEWHHVAWQYGYARDEHELLLDGQLIWKLGCVDGVALVNDRGARGTQRCSCHLLTSIGRIRIPCRILCSRTGPVVTICDRAVPV
jgi:hypothetical protein